MTDTTPKTPCPTTETLLALAHGELPLADVPAVRAHVRQCPRCAEEMNIMKQIGTEIGGLAEAVEAPAGLRSRVLSGLRFRERRTRWNIFDVVRIGAATAAGAIALTVIAVQFPRSELTAAKNERLSRDLHGVSREPPPLSPSSSASNEGRPLYTPPSAAMPAKQQRQAQGFAGFPGGVGGGAPGALPLEQLRQQDREQSDASRWQATRPRMVVPQGGPDVTPDDVRKYTRGAAIEDPKRKVVHNLALGVRVNRQLEGLQDEITARVRKDGGYVENANLNSAAGGERTAQMTLRVPVERFDAMTQWLSGLGEVKTKSASGEDVTGTWVDQRAELREFRAEEERLQKEYDKAKTVNAREMVRYQLLRLRTRIRSSEERFALTTKLAALATVHLSLTEEPQARVRGSLLPDMDNTFRSALSAFMVAIRIPLGALIWLAVFSPLWVPCVLLYRWATRKALERDLATKPAA